MDNHSRVAKTCHYSPTMTPPALLSSPLPNTVADRRRRILPAHALLLSLLLALALLAPCGKAADLTSLFDTGTDSWLASAPGTTLTWEPTGGASAGYLKAVGTGGAWYYVSPPAWSGNWSAYRTLKFDLGIPSRHYADSDSAGMVVITGTNAQSMTWTGATPLWTWTHFDVSLQASSFGVSQATFAGIMASVANVRILGEFTTTNETVGLDNVVLTTVPATIHGSNLVERFTGAVADPLRASLAGWSRVDDVNILPNPDGVPLLCLYGDDLQDGRLFKIASPEAWAGDWRGFNELRFDLKWLSSGSAPGGADLVRIFGANGQQLVWSTTLVENQWTHFAIPLTPAAFGVNAATFEGVMSFVSKIWIAGEWGDGNDELYLDNITVATGPETPRVLGNSIVSRFGTGAEGWSAFDGATPGWNATGGFSNGCITCTDTGSGTARFVSPDTWSGVWSSFTTLRFMLKPQGTSGATLPPVVSIHGFNGGVLTVSPPLPYNSWSPYTFDLTPQTFGVTQAVFDAVIGNVAHVTIVGDLVNGADTTVLDDVSLTAASVPIGAPPERRSDFDTGIEGWRKGGVGGTTWRLLAAAPEYLAANGNPGGNIAANDDFTLTYWLTPENWAGDWRGHGSVSFDLRILTGTSLLAPGNMISVISVHGVMEQPVAQSPALNTWNHYEFALTPAAFAVSQATFDTIMRDVVMIGIRSEWINGTEKEALDNVRSSRATAAYWLWLSTYLNPAQLADESISGPQADADRDGSSNFAEYLALTSPTDPQSRFLAVAQRVGGGMEIQYPTKTGRVYQVWKSTTLANDWQPVGPLVPGDNTIKVYANPMTDLAAFFRVAAGLP